MQVDPKFTQGRRYAAARTRRRWLRRAGVVGVLGAGALFWLWPKAGEETLVQVESAVVAPMLDGSAFLDIAGDPLVLRLSGDTTRLATLAGPPTLPATRFGPPAPDRMIVLSDDLVLPDQEILALPSTDADFARIQASREGALDGTAILPTEGTVLTLSPEGARRPLYNDRVLQLAEARPLADVAQGAPLPDPLPAGSVVALRSDDAGVMQAAVYDAGGFVAAAARVGGELVPSADPWLDDDLLSRADAGVGAAEMRLLDAIYATAARNGVGSEVVGALISMLGRIYDLQGIAVPGDRLVLVHAARHGAGGSAAGQILFAALEGTAGRRVCYVTQGANGDFACFAPGVAGDGPVGSDAVESLIARIIQVESAGVATAKNPRSSATGLGQFISSTWLRMIRAHRPDLAALPEAELLALRNDPALSRQMVLHLAQENEGYLRARGQIATPGRLYLAHFLGPADALHILAADGAAPLVTLLSPSVISANPFLTNFTATDLRNWADAKMQGRSAPPPPLPPEIAVFAAMVDTMLAESGLKDRQISTDEDTQTRQGRLGG